MTRRPALAVLTAGVLVALAAGADARGGCVRNFKFCAGCSIDVPMNVKSGKVCTINLHATGGVFGQQTLVAPKHGKYGTANETSTAYLASPGYTGPDYFEARLYYELPGGKKTFTVMRVNVNVTPAEGGDLKTAR